MNSHHHYSKLPDYFDDNNFFTDIYDQITSNGRISKKLFEKVVEPQLHRGLKAIEELSDLQKRLSEAEELIKKIREIDWNTDHCDAKNMLADEYLEKYKHQLNDTK